ncbi:DUF2730 family protein [Sphingobium aquiterrae]|uniref:DUF2730 family protein n=1 Tax=Sphingobium aquiterrae TaxID=2038656 RepID=UPI003016D1C5
MPAWFGIINDLWPIATTITPLILTAGFLWLRTKFPTKEDFDRLVTKVDAIDEEQIKCTTRLDNIAADLDDPPTRVDLLEQMAKISGRMSGVEQQCSGLRDRLNTANDLLQIIIDRGLAK